MYFPDFHIHVLFYCLATFVAATGSLWKREELPKGEGRQVAHARFTSKEFGIPFHFQILSMTAILFIL